MHKPAWGEISSPGLNEIEYRDGTGAEPYEGRSARFGEWEQGKGRLILWDAAARMVTIMRRTSVWEDAGWNPGKGYLQVNPGRENPREHPVRHVLKTHDEPGILERVKAQKPDLMGPDRESGSNHELNGRWVHPIAETHGYLLRGVSFEGWIPWALSVWNKTDPDSKGGNRHEGNQTLKTERSGWFYPRHVDLRILMCCREVKSMRGVQPVQPVELGFDLNNTLRRWTRREDASECLKQAFRAARFGKTIKPREWTNGKMGSWTHNTVLTELNTLNA